MKLQFHNNFYFEALQAASVSLKGGEFIIKESNPFATFTPEDFDEEQKMVMEQQMQQ